MGRLFKFLGAKTPVLPAAVFASVVTAVSVALYFAILAARPWPWAYQRGAADA